MPWIYCLARACFVAAFFLSISQPSVRAQAQNQPPTSSNTGMWVWHRATIEDSVQREQMLAFSQRHGISRLLVNIFFDTGDGRETLGTFGQPLKDLLKEAAAKKIVVEALDGGPERGLASERARTLSRLDAILAFNQTLPPGKRLVGVHYDIEPYLCPRWKVQKDYQGVMGETLETLAQIQQHVRKSDPTLSIAYDIPAWYGKKPELTINFHGATKNFHEHIQDLSDYVGVMSYRTVITGHNAITDLCSPALAYAQKTGKHVYAAVETRQLPQTPLITFYGDSPDQFLKALDEIQAVYGHTPAFGGILIHSYDHMLVLLGASGSVKP